jgi:hypothetical protein
MFVSVSAWGLTRLTMLLGWSFEGQIDCLDEQDSERDLKPVRPGTAIVTGAATIPQKSPELTLILERSQRTNQPQKRERREPQNEKAALESRNVKCSSPVGDCAGRLALFSGFPLFLLQWVQQLSAAVAQTHTQALPVRPAAILSTENKPRLLGRTKRATTP